MRAFEHAHGVDEPAQHILELLPAQVTQAVEDASAILGQRDVPDRQHHRHKNEDNGRRPEQHRELPAEREQGNAGEAQKAAGEPSKAIEREHGRRARRAVAAERALAEVRAQHVGARGGGHDSAEESAGKVPGHDLGERHLAVGDEARDQLAPVPGLREAVREEQGQRCAEKGEVDARQMARDRLQARVAREPCDDGEGGRLHEATGRSLCESGTCVQR